jgi:hypothetical protein
LAAKQFRALNFDYFWHKVKKNRYRAPCPSDGDELAGREDGLGNLSPTPKAAGDIRSG